MIFLGFMFPGLAFEVYNLWFIIYCLGFLYFGYRVFGLWLRVSVRVWFFLCFWVLGFIYDD